MYVYSKKTKILNEHSYLLTEHGAVVRPLHIFVGRTVISTSRFFLKKNISLMDIKITLKLN